MSYRFILIACLATLGLAVAGWGQADGKIALATRFLRKLTIATKKHLAISRYRAIVVVLFLSLVSFYACGLGTITRCYYWVQTGSPAIVTTQCITGTGKDFGLNAPHESPPWKRCGYTTTTEECGRWLCENWITSCD